eukprot:scaffold4543_cov126-Isochrysis_galbana.AAC.9
MPAAGCPPSLATTPDPAAGRTGQAVRTDAKGETSPPPAPPADTRVAATATECASACRAESVPASGPIPGRAWLSRGRARPRGLCAPPRSRSAWQQQRQPPRRVRRTPMAPRLKRGCAPAALVKALPAGVRTAEPVGWLVRGDANPGSTAAKDLVACRGMEAGPREDRATPCARACGGGWPSGAAACSAGKSRGPYNGDERLRRATSYQQTARQSGDQAEKLDQRLPSAEYLAALSLQRGEKCDCFELRSRSAAVPELGRWHDAFHLPGVVWHEVVSQAERRGVHTLSGAGRAG